MPYARPEFLTEFDWLAAHLDDDDVRVLEVTGMLTGKFENLAKARCFDIEHIRGAQFLDVASGKGELTDPDGQYPWTWPSPAQVTEVMRQLGVDNDSKVVLYARSPRAGVDNGTMWCTRAWWILHHFGVSVSVLNGSYEAWVADGLPLSSEVSALARGSFAASGDGLEAIAVKEQVLLAIEDPGACVVDALSPASFAGTQEVAYGPRRGHITGAVNVPMGALYDTQTGRFQTAERLEQAFDEKGVLDGSPILTYCGGAIAATVDAFALALLGREDVAVYDNSLFEWSGDEGLPMTDPNGGDGG